MRNSSSRNLFPAILAAALSLYMGAGSAWADPTPEEQYWLELVNHARMDPAGELERLVNFATASTFGNPSSDIPGVAAAMAFFGTDAATLAAQWVSLTPAPALAWNDNLGNSAANYSQTMATLDQQSHMLNTSQSTIDGAVTERILASGYSGNYLQFGENLYASAQSIAHGHAGFLIDWGDSDLDPNNGYGTGIQTQGDPLHVSHREVTYDKLFKEIGIGVLSSGLPVGNVNAVGPLIATQHFGSKYRFANGIFLVDAILTGVMYNDTLLADNFYTPGEGLGGRAIEVYDNNTNVLLFTGTTNSAGGFNIEMQGVIAGEELRIAAPGLGLPDQLVTVTGFTEPSTTYGVPVTFFNNPYAAFQVVPEPGGLGLAAIAIGMSLRRRRQPALA